MDFEISACIIIFARFCFFGFGLIDHKIKLSLPIDLKRKLNSEKNNTNKYFCFKCTFELLQELRNLNKFMEWIEGN